MGRIDFFALLLCVALIHSTIAYPTQSSEEDDTQQQQQQNIDSDSLEELTQKIQAKGKRPQKLQVTELEPEPEPYDPCLDGKKIGPCKGRVPRFFFNQATGSCERFSWGGCSKTGNNFKELTECETSCSKHLTRAKLDVEQDQATVVATCEKPPVRQGGPECEAYIPRWTFNATQQQCVQFIWGGCGKTENNFATESSCKATCGEYSNLKNNNGASTTTTPSSRDLQQQQNADVVGPEPPKSKDVCDLPSESGLCLAYFERYYFNKINNRCELFTYGGCGGNENRFDTAEDCVRACGGDSPVNDPQCADVECPWALYDHYYSLGCSPIYDGEACCPTRYECPDNQQELQNNTLDSRSLTLERENEDGTTVGPETTMPQKCRYRGKYYNVGEQVNEASDTGSCRAGCICVDSEPESPRIVCAQIECAEHFSGRPPGKEKCIPLYKKDSCCAHDYHCPEGPLTVVDPSQQEADKVLPLAKCMVDGEGYYEGQRVYPNKSPCSKCLCQRNPANITSPEGQLYCEKIDCGVEIYYSHYLARGCAPVYYEKEDGTTSCCPISWECPDEQHGGQDETEGEDVATTPGTSVPGPQPPKPPSTDVPTSTTVPPTTIRPNSPLTRSHEACTLPKAEGSCKGHRPRFYYNAETEKCESFVYTGCRGNFNNFASIEDCRDLCEPGAVVTSTPATPPAKGGKSGGLLGRSGLPPPPTPPRETKAISLTEVDACTLPKRVGRCKGYFPRFHYSPEDNECKLFIFGGCRPNANNFYTKDSCEATCLNEIPVENLRTNLPANALPERRLANNEEGGDATRVNFGEEERTFDLRTPRPPVPPASASASSEEENPCTLPPRTGRCKAFVRRFYYDTDKKMCKGFTYGGCSGNANNFQSLEECDAKCTTNRRIETNLGPRSGQGWRIASNDGGNVNTTPSPTGASVPPSAGFTARCKLPKQAGSCHASVRSYYYDVETKSCKLFFYSGCFGNANRFSSREDCENLCKKPLESETSTPPESTNGAINQPGRPQVHDLSEPSSTANPVETIEQEAPKKEFCSLDPAPGNCKANQLRFYYDAAAEQCLPFVYTGCRGNQNNFVTERDCKASCGTKPTLEQLSDEMVLTCSFGNRSLPLGATVGGTGGKSNDGYSVDEPPCGVPVCQCITPPAVTCVQRMCPEPTTTTTPIPTAPYLCATPTCLHHCREAIGIDGCPTCDCPTSNGDGDSQSETVIVKAPAKGVKGVKG